MYTPAHESFSSRLNFCVRQVLRLLVFVSLGLTACSVVHDTAVGSYQVAAAPFKLFHHSTPTPTPTPVPPPPPPTPTPGRKAAHDASPPPKSSASPSAAKKPLPSPSQRPAQSAVFPTAKPVPDKPGYVFSPSQPTKYVDVTGYASGSKVKDPYSGQIFIVP